MDQVNKLIPKRRFKEFQTSEAWEQREFGELADYKKGPFGSVLKKDIFVPKSDDVVKVYEQQNAIKKDSKLERYFITKEYAKKLNGFEVLPGEIIISCAGTIGEMYVLPSSAEIGIINQALMRVRVNERIVDKTLFKYLFSNMIDSFSRTHSNGSAIKNIPPFADLKPMKVRIPIIKEQHKIVVLLTNLDNLITLHQRKLDKIKSLKKSYLSEMFPAEGESVPKRRFTGFTEAWEQCKLLESVDNIIDFRGRTPKKLGMDWSETGYLALSALNVKNGFIDAEVDAHYGDQKLYDVWMSGNELHQGQVLFTTEAPMGNVAQVPDNKGYILSQRTIAFEVKKDLITENYLAVVLGSPKSFSALTALSSGGTAKGVSQKSLSGFYISVPRELKEQDEIAKLFMSLDNLITLHQRKLEKLQNLKKAYLNEMFV